MDRIPVRTVPLPMPQTLRQRVGQLVASGFRGLTTSEAVPVVAAVREGSLGGVLLFSVDEETGEPKNVRSASQLRRLIAGLDVHPTLPIIAAIDAEGTGFYQQLRPEHGFPPTISAQELGERNDPKATYAMAAAMARWMAGVGITLNLAPVVDLLHSGNMPIAGRRRAFASDPDFVVAHAREFIKAHHDQGVLCALKHFPGVGSAGGETFEGARDLASTWSENELEPYRVLIADGLADVILTQHVFHRGLDPARSAAMSPRIATGLLRDELGFEGVLATSTFEMESVWNHYGLERAVVQAVKAGVDLIMLSNPSFEIPYDENRPSQVVDALLAAVERGDIPEPRIDEACRRVLRLKERQLAVQAEAASMRPAD